MAGQPKKPSDAQLDRVVGGAITEQRTNPADNQTQGKGKAIDVEYVDPQDKAPPGQNKYAASPHVTFWTGGREDHGNR